MNNDVANWLWEVLTSESCGGDGNKLRVKWGKKSALICGVLSLMSDSLIIYFLT